MDNGKLWTLNLDTRFDLNTKTYNPVWGGIGVGVIHREIQNFRNTDYGVNLQWGMDFDQQQRWMPFISTKAVLSDKSYFMVGFGVRFGGARRSGTAANTAD